MSEMHPPEACKGLPVTRLDQYTFSLPARDEGRRLLLTATDILAARPLTDTELTPEQRGERDSLVVDLNHTLRWHRAGLVGFVNSTLVDETGRVIVSASFMPHDAKRLLYALPNLAAAESSEAATIFIPDSYELFSHPASILAWHTGTSPETRRLCIQPHLSSIACSEAIERACLGLRMRAHCVKREDEEPAPVPYSIGLVPLKQAIAIQRQQFLTYLEIPHKQTTFYDGGIAVVALGVSVDYELRESGKRPKLCSDLMLANSNVHGVPQFEGFSSVIRSGIHEQIDLKYFTRSFGTPDAGGPFSIGSDF